MAKDKTTEPDNKSEVAIKVNGVYKDFNLPHEINNSLKQKLIKPFKRTTVEKQHALKDITFEVKKGDFFGIVGRNGSGKSTLLKIISEIYTPTKGSVEVTGSLTPFIELGVGFNAELTGKENVFLNGAMLGFNKREMEEMYDEIVDFSELEIFMDQKLKNYSSGMQVRLAFSVAIRAKSDILILDEVLAVGDYEFQQKCIGYFETLKKAKKTVILVSHSSETVQQFCNKAIYLEDSRIVSSGSTMKVLAEYLATNTKRAEEKSKKNATGPEVEGPGIVKLIHAKTKDSEGKIKKVFRPNEDLQICFTYSSDQDLEDLVAGVVVAKNSGETVFATNTLDGKHPIKFIKKGQTLEATFTVKNIYNDGQYSVSGALANKHRTKTHVRVMNATTFKSIGWTNTAKALVYTDYKFDTKQLTDKS